MQAAKFQEKLHEIVMTKPEVCDIVTSMQKLSQRSSFTEDEIFEGFSRRLTSMLETIKCDTSFVNEFQETYAAGTGRGSSDTSIFGG
jgi:hypothetical protein